MATVTIMINDTTSNDIDGCAEGVSVEVCFDPVIEADQDPTAAQIFAVRALQAMEELDEGQITRATLQ